MKVNFRVTAMKDQIKMFKIDRALFVLAFCASILFIAFFLSLLRIGSSVQIDPYVAPIVNHTETIYVTYQQRVILWLLEAGMFISISLLLCYKLFQHFQGKN